MMDELDTVDQNMFALKDIGSLAELLYNFAIAFDQIGIEQESFACCRKCGEQLTSVYMGNNIYMAVCPECKTVTRAKASYSIQALARLGDWMGESKAEQLGRPSYGFEIKKEYVDKFNSELAGSIQTSFYNLEQQQMQFEARNAWSRKV